MKNVLYIKKYDLKVTNTELNNNSAEKRNEKRFKNNTSDKFMEEKISRRNPLNEIHKDKFVTSFQI